MLVLAIAAAADFALKLPPLGHKTTTSSAAVSPQVVAQAAAARATAQERLTKNVLLSAAAHEKAYRAKSGLYTSSIAQLDKAGMTRVLAPAVLVAQAHHGTGFCLAAGAQATGDRFFLYDSVRGGFRPTVYRTEAAALKGCSQHA